MLRMEAIWLAVGASDLRGGMDSLLGQVVARLGSAQRHHAYHEWTSDRNRRQETSNLGAPDLHFGCQEGLAGRILIGGGQAQQRGDVVGQDLGGHVDEQGLLGQARDAFQMNTVLEPGAKQSRDQGA